MQTLNRSTFILAICLSALAGGVDVIGFLHLGGFFISFMSGNSTRLAANLATHDTHAVTMLAGIIALFVIGAMLGVFVRHFSEPTRATINVLGFVTLLLLAAVLCYENGLGFPTIACMTLAMGAENAILQRNGDVVVGLTYMTGTLVKIGQRLAGAVLGSHKLAWVPYLLLWIGLITGGIIGAILFDTLGLRSLWIAVSWSAILTIATIVFKKKISV